MQGRLFQPHLRSLLSACAALVIISGCSDSPTGPGGPQGEFVFRASVVGTTIATMVVEVTAPDITTPLVFNIPIASGVASGTVKLPPGENRTITLRAYDNLQNETHEGSKTINVKPGQNPPVSIPVVSKAGQVPITATMGPVSVVVTPANREITVGGTVQMTATISAPNGDILAGPASWATLNPSIASVDANGLVTAVGQGTVQIVATYAGVGGSGTIQIGSTLAVSGTSLTLYDNGTQALQATYPLGSLGFSVTHAEDGKLYVGGNSVIWRIDPASGTTENRGIGNVFGNLYGLTARNGVLYASGSGMPEVHTLTYNDGPTPIGNIPSPLNTNLRSTTFGPDGSFYLTAFAPPVQRWLPGFVPVGGFGSGVPGMTTSFGIDTRSNGNVVISGQNDRAYFVFSATGAFINKVDVNCPGGNLHNLAVDFSDNVWVTCTQDNAVVKFSPLDVEVARITVNQPWGVTVY
jgi:hypothetical protein